MHRAPSKSAPMTCKQNRILTMSKVKFMTRSLLLGLLCLPVGPEMTMAAPTSVITNSVVMPASDISLIRKRRVVRRSSVGPAAVLGLFGAIIGGAIANDRYDNYSNYSYGDPYGYSYSPGYRQSPGPSMRAQRSFGRRGPASFQGRPRAGASPGGQHGASRTHR